MPIKRLHLGVLALTLLVLGVLAGYSLVQNGYFPVAWVNGDPLSLKTVQDNMRVSQRLYQAGAIEGEEYRNLFESTAGSQELFRRVFENLITGSLIASAAPEEAHQAAEEKVGAAVTETENSQLRRMLKEAYGWDIQTFRARMLRPQALQEALVEQKGEQYEQWLAEVQRRAEVNIWFVPYEWENGELVNQ